MLIKSFRLFVSSTFADFQAEREVLQSQVFPALDAYCAAKGYQFYPLDMRWGISEEAGLDQRTADICLEEVAAANGYPPPNFLILLGDRYGWVPLPFAIACDELEAMLAWLDGRSDRDGADAIRHVYRLDENRLISPGLKGGGANGGVYTLLSREDDLLGLRDREAWAAVEGNVRAALQRASEGLLQDGRIDAVARDKYILSLTEREIRGNLDATAENGRGGEAIVFIRTLNGPCPSLREQDPQSIAAVAALRQRVERALADDRVMRGSSTCDASGNLDAAYLAAFAAAVEAKLKEAIDRHIDKVEAIERGPDYALHAEREEHAAFRAEKLKVFVGRESNLAAIARYLASNAAHPLVLHGPSGSGKTALVARAIEAAAAAKHPRIVYRFIGASAGSSDPRSLLLSLIDDLVAHELVERPAEFDQDANKLAAQIKALLASISGRAVIFLDALDQLKKPYRLDWLPDTLPTGVRLVLSVLDDPAYETDSEVYRLLRMRRLPEDAFLAIEPLTPAHGRDILLALETLANRELRDGQRNVVLRHFEAPAAGASPLYLRTAFEIAKGWRSWEADAGQQVLAASTLELIAQFIAGLTSEHHHEPELVTRTLGFLAAAKDGLSAKELTEVLSNDDGVMRAISTEQHGHRTKRLPPSVWARLHRALLPFLIEKRIDDQPLLHFFHRQVAEVARRDHYESAKSGLHAELATYFEDRATPLEGRKVYDKRSLSELPYQLHHVGDAPHAARLNDILLSPDWMQQKLATFASPLTLVDDYRAYAPYDPATKTAAALVGRALSQSVGALDRDQRQLVPHLLGRLRADMASGIDSVITRLRLAVRPPALVPRGMALAQADSAHLATLEGHEDDVNAVAFSPDGRRIVSGSRDGTLRLWDAETGEAIGHPMEGHNDAVETVAFSRDGQRIVSGSHDKTLRLWVVDSGRQIGPTLQGHKGAVRSAAFSPDGQLIVSGSSDRTLRIWNAVTGTEICPPLVGHKDWVSAVACSPNGRHIASSSQDNTLRLWDLAKGRPLGEEITGHTGVVSAVAFSPNGQCVISGSHDRTLRMWDVTTGNQIGSSLRGHLKEVLALAVSADGRHIVSGSWDKTVRIWSAASGKEIGAPLVGHSDVVNAVAYSPDGRRIVSCSSDRTLMLWDADVTVATKPIPNSHLDQVNVVAFSPNGKRIISGSADKSMLLWAADTGAQVGPRFQGHSGPVNSVAFSPDGQRLVSGSGDGDVRIWDAESSAPVGAPLSGHDNPVMAVAFSTDGRLIASRSWDKSLRHWDVNSGAPVDPSLAEYWSPPGRPPEEPHILARTRTLILREAGSKATLTQFEADARIVSVAPFMEMRAIGDATGRVYLLDLIVDDSAKLRWLERITEAHRDVVAPAPPPFDIDRVAAGMQVTVAQLAKARFIENYDRRHLFMLADGRIYLDGLIAVSSIDHARATLDELARRAGAQEA